MKVSVLQADLSLCLYVLITWLQKATDCSSSKLIKNRFGAWLAQRNVNN